MSQINPKVISTESAEAPRNTRHLVQRREMLLLL